MSGYADRRMTGFGTNEAVRNHRNCKSCCQAGLSIIITIKEVSTLDDIIDVTAAIIHRKHEFLIARRRSGSLRGFWEFPGGKTRSGETLEDCLRREIREEMDVEIAIERPVLSVPWCDGTRRIRLPGDLCRWVSGEPVARDHESVVWIRCGELGRFQFAPADRPIVDYLVNSFDSRDFRDD